MPPVYVWEALASLFEALAHWSRQQAQQTPLEPAPTAPAPTHTPSTTVKSDSESDSETVFSEAPLAPRRSPRTTCLHCVNPAVYLRRCPAHQLRTGRQVCTTCYQPSYRGHNNDCEGRKFISASRPTF